MNLETLREQFPEYAKDIKLNLSSVLSESGSPGLTQKQIFGIALTSAYACKNSTLIEAFQAESHGLLTDADIQGIKAANTIMAMNNIYYRSTHLIQDSALKSLPARLRMNIMANPGIPKLDFELYSFAISAINGCGMCLDSHNESLKKEGQSVDGIQSTLKIAAVVHAAHQVIFMLKN